MRRLTLFAVFFVVAALGSACGDSAADPERLCEIFAELNEDDDFLPPGEASTARQRDIILEAKKVAPDEIRSSVELVADANLAVLELWEEADFDIVRVDEAAFSALLTDEVDTAGKEAAAWESANCST